MESWAAQFASDMSTQGHLLADLFTAGTTQVFNTEANRKKYDQSLKREKMKEFFSLLKNLHFLQNFYSKKRQSFFKRYCCFFSKKKSCIKFLFILFPNNGLPCIKTIENFGSFK